MIKKITVCTLLLGLNIPGQLCGARPERNDNQSWVQKHPYATATLAAITSAALGFWVAGKFYSLRRPPIKQTPPPLPPQFIPTMSLEQKEILTLRHDFALFQRDVNILKEQQRSRAKMSYGILGSIASLAISTASFAWKYPSAMRDLLFGWFLVRIDTAVNAIRTDDLPIIRGEISVVNNTVTSIQKDVNSIRDTDLPALKQALENYMQTIGEASQTQMTEMEARITLLHLLTPLLTEQSYKTLLLRVTAERNPQAIIDLTHRMLVVPSPTADHRILPSRMSFVDFASTNNIIPMQCSPAFMFFTDESQERKTQVLKIISQQQSHRFTLPGSTGTPHLLSKAIMRGLPGPAGHRP